MATTTGVQREEDRFGTVPQPGMSMSNEEVSLGMEHRTEQSFGESTLEPPCSQVQCGDFHERGGTDEPAEHGNGPKSH